MPLHTSHTKTSAEIITYGHDFGRWLATGEAISTASVAIVENGSGAVVTGAMLVATTIVGTQVNYQVQAGENGKNYSLTLSITTTLANLFQDCVHLEIRDF